MVSDAEIAQVAFPELEDATFPLENLSVYVSELSMLENAFIRAAVEELRRVTETWLVVVGREGQVPVVTYL